MELSYDGAGKFVAKKKGKVDRNLLNFPGFTPTDTKTFKEIIKEVGGTGSPTTQMKRGFMAYVNAMSKEDYNAKGIRDHYRAFLSKS